MELHQLRYFLAVVDEGTFTAAASAVRVSQSGISTQVQKLERELGLQLIDRSARTIRLTPAGSRIVPYARAAVAAFEDVTGAANDLRGLVVGSLRLGTVTGLAWPPLLDALAVMHQAHPGVEIGLHEGNSDELVTQVREGTTDVAIAAWSGPDPAGVSTAMVVDDPLVVVVAPEHPWARRSLVRPRELARADLVTLPRGTGARAALDALLARAGVDREPRWVVSTPAYVETLTARGLGVGVVSGTTARDWDHLATIAVADEQARSRLGVVWARHPTHAARALLERLLPGEVREGP
jgi:DNA-binding transcriptional LysR family regulator